MCDTNLHYKDCSKMYFDSCSQVTSSCRCSITITMDNICTTKDLLKNERVLGKGKGGCSGGLVVSTSVSHQCGPGLTPSWVSDPGAISEKSCLSKCFDCRSLIHTCSWIFLWSSWNTNYCSQW